MACKGHTTLPESFDMARATWAAGGAARWSDTATIYGEVDDSRSQAALGWILARSAIALPVPGFTRPEQVEDNLGALEKGPLPAAAMAEIDAVLNIAETA